ncbi:hypothetical protein RchiOBHm_Chr6g0250031 [Rosa chinensis]|uniref:Uncharacterized protein n=1 Tax=Rosa chinensis TaxID=74649 RepID=A0A2P6PKF3_ROSCH|nr:hypothetical protein RchiOBHm_Chr6g0250031 [Rosa chinensis]
MALMHVIGTSSQQLIDHGHQMMDETDQAIDRAQRFFIRLSTEDYDFECFWGFLQYMQVLSSDF